MTILAARRVAAGLDAGKASKPFMKLNGPLAVPPPSGLRWKKQERFIPVPSPLNGFLRSWLA
jgi:hypothetical protein